MIRDSDVSEHFYIISYDCPQADNDQGQWRFRAFLHYIIWLSTSREWSGTVTFQSISTLYHMIVHKQRMIRDSDVSEHFYIISYDCPQAEIDQGLWRFRAFPHYIIWLSTSREWSGTVTFQSISTLYHMIVHKQRMIRDSDVSEHFYIISYDCPQAEIDQGQWRFRAFLHYIIWLSTSRDWSGTVTFQSISTLYHMIVHKQRLIRDCDVSEHFYIISYDCPQAEIDQGKWRFRAFPHYIIWLSTSREWSGTVTFQSISTLYHMIVHKQRMIRDCDVSEHFYIISYDCPQAENDQGQWRFRAFPHYIIWLSTSRDWSGTVTFQSISTLYHMIIHKQRMIRDCDVSEHFHIISYDCPQAENDQGLWRFRAFLHYIIWLSTSREWSGTVTFQSISTLYHMTVHKQRMIRDSDVSEHFNLFAAL